MFEKLIEGIILQYFGEYIDNLDRNKLQVGVSDNNALFYIAFTYLYSYYLDIW